jgi:hypothetical protein
VGTDPLAVGGNAQSVPEPAGVGLYLGAGLALSAAAKRRAAREAMSG